MREPGTLETGYKNNPAIRMFKSCNLSTVWIAYKIKPDIRPFSSGIKGILISGFQCTKKCFYTGAHALSVICYPSPSPPPFIAEQAIYPFPACLPACAPPPSFPGVLRPRTSSTWPFQSVRRDAGMECDAAEDGDVLDRLYCQAAAVTRLRRWVYSRNWPSVGSSLG